MLKKLEIGFGVLMLALVAFSVFTSNHPEAVHAPAEPKAGPADRAMHLCESWTRTNSKLAVDEVVWEENNAGPNRVSLDYRTKGPGVLMHTVCDYSVVQDQVVLVAAKSSLK